MKSKLFYLMLALILNMYPCYAELTQSQKIHLKDGSVLTGVISSQKPGVSLTVTAYEADVILDSKKVQNIVSEELSEDRLTEEWKNWANLNAAWMGTTEKRSLLLHNVITTEGKTYSRVLLKQTGTKVRFLQMEKDEYLLTWDQIEKVSVDKRPKTILSGIDRVYKLSNGQEYQGQYAGETPGVSLELYEPSGTIVSLDPSSVIKYAIKPYNANQSLFEQSEWLDVIVTKEATYTGLIIENNYNDKETSENYILLSQQNGSIISLKTSAVSEFRKQDNSSNCKIRKDVILPKGKILINRQDVDSVAIKENNGVITLSPFKPKLAFKKTQSIVEILVETNIDIPSIAAQMKLVPIRNVTIKDKKKINVALGFTFEDLVKKAIAPGSVETTANNTYRIKFEADLNGLYVLYNNTTNVYPFTVIQ